MPVLPATLTVAKIGVEVQHFLPVACLTLWPIDLLAQLGTSDPDATKGSQGLAVPL
jgi:hypothetical protein